MVTNFFNYLSYVWDKIIELLSNNAPFGYALLGVIVSIILFDVLTNYFFRG